MTRRARGSAGIPAKAALVGPVVGGIVLADQLTKWLVRRLLAPYEVVPVIPGLLNLTHVYNTGGAFSFLADAPDGVRVPFFLIASLAAVVALIYYLWHVDPGERGMQFALAAVLGGAAGNLIDRMVLGKVTDFIDLHWGAWHWPAFNVADSFITIGVALLVVGFLFGGDSRRD